MQHCLLRGEREKAVEDAISSGHYAMALLIASMCSREIYFSAAKQYTDRVLVAGSPLHTVSMLYCAQFEGPHANETTSCLWGEDGDSLKKEWRSHLAAVISNRRTGWDRVVLSLGDRLRDLGETIPAHFCYMVCGCALSSPLRKDSRMTLLGRDVSSMDALLLTNAAIESFSRTEAYEWAKRKGNKNAAIQSLQAFKLRYAMLLCDLGLQDEAKNYLLSVKQCLDIESTDLVSIGDSRQHLLLSILASDRQSLLQLIAQLEQRLVLRNLDHSLQRPSSAENQSNMSASFITACTSAEELPTQGDHETGPNKKLFSEKSAETENAGAGDMAGTGRSSRSNGKNGAHKQAQLNLASAARIRSDVHGSRTKPLGSQQEGQPPTRATSSNESATNPARESVSPPAMVPPTGKRDDKQAAKAESAAFKTPARGRTDGNPSPKQSKTPKVQSAPKSAPANLQSPSKSKLPTETKER